jgi:hypothetical protein
MGSFHGKIVRLVMPVKEIFCLALAVLDSPVQNIFFLTIHFIRTFVPIGQQTGQAVVLGHLSLGMCFCC